MPAGPPPIVTFLEGIAVRRPRAQHCGALGQALARLHLAGARFPDGRGRTRCPSRAGRPCSTPPRRRPTRVATGLAERTRRELDTPARLADGLPAGIIHADLFTDNVFFIGREVSGLIDFYFACTDALAYDLAICLNAWCFEPDGSFNLTKGQAMIAGYQSVRRLEAARSRPCRSSAAARPCASC